MLDEAAILASRYGGGLLIAEALATALLHGSQLWFGTPTNVGLRLREAAAQLGSDVHVVA